MSRHKTKTEPDKMCPVYNRLNRSDEERQWVFLVDPCAYHFFCKWHHLKYSHFGRQLPAEFPASKMLSMSDARQREWAVYHDPQATMLIGLQFQEMVTASKSPQLHSAVA